ncbi:MAG: hypothetical protein ACE5JS_08590 [Nitrospinota bacterium]
MDQTFFQAGPGFGVIVEEFLLLPHAQGAGYAGDVIPTRPYPNSYLLKEFNR